MGGEIESESMGVPLHRANEIFLKGRIYQVEYAHEATRRGCSIVGIADSKWAVLAAWRPALSNTRACPPRLVWDVDPHVGIAAAG
jgi:20S proteasome alpha/beta subunit